MSGMRKRYFFRRPPRSRLPGFAGLFAIGLVASACAAPPVLTAFSAIANGISLANSGKTLSDHVISAAADQDCRLFRVIRGKAVCTANDANDADVRLADADDAQQDGADRAITVAAVAPVRPVTVVRLDLSDPISPPAPAVAKPAEPRAILPFVEDRPGSRMPVTVPRSPVADPDTRAADLRPDTGPQAPRFVPEGAQSVSEAAPAPEAAPSAPSLSAVARSQIQDRGVDLALGPARVLPPVKPPVPAGLASADPPLPTLKPMAARDRALAALAQRVPKPGQKPASPVTVADLPPVPPPLPAARL